MREIRTSGLMSGIWKRKKRSDIQTPTNRKGRKQLRLNLIPPRQISTLLHCYWEPTTAANTTITGRTASWLPKPKTFRGHNPKRSISGSSRPRAPYAAAGQTKANNITNNQVSD